MSGQLFTFVCEFRGGTYVSQVRAADHHCAFAEWAQTLRRDTPMGEAAVIADEAIGEADSLTDLQGLSGVWCWTAAIDGALVLANIIRSE